MIQWNQLFSAKCKTSQKDKKLKNNKSLSSNDTSRIIQILGRK